MTQQPLQRRTSPWIVWTALLLLVVVLYFASYGPVMWLATHDRMSIETFERLHSTVYYPILWIEWKTDFFNNSAIARAYGSYVFWWGADPHRRK